MCRSNRFRSATSRPGPAVSYPVFFRRYATKDELLEDIATEEVRSLLSITRPIFEADELVEALRALCTYVDERRALWSRLLTGGAAAAMREEFKRVSKEIGSTREPTQPWLPT